MPRAASVVLILLALQIDASSSVQVRMAAAQNSQRAFVSEQHWIVADVANAIAGMSQAVLPESRQDRTVTVRIQSTLTPTSVFAVNIGQGAAVRLTVDGHLWSPVMYAPLAGALFTPPAAGDTTDHNARGALVKLTTRVLLDENERISVLLTGDIRSAGAHESAALLVGALALREAWSMFGDVRPALSRMAAHLAVADAVRGDTAEGIDGTLARAVLTLLAGRERDALTILDQLVPRAQAEPDTAWIRALRRRITGDWRATIDTQATLLERFEQARALRTRIGPEALLGYLESFEPEPVTDWARIALSDFLGTFNVETGHRFADEAIDNELAEATLVWQRFHPGSNTDSLAVSALNDRPAPSPVVHRDGALVVTVLDWGAWAAFQQRQLCHILTARSRHFYNLGARSALEDMGATFKVRFKDLTLFPAVLRWIALTPADYAQSVADGAALVAESPELVTASTWNFFADKAPFVQRAAAFPFIASWMTPAVPPGTAFDLHARALLPGCPRPPTRIQARIWADAAPHDHWTVWSAEWMAVNGKPTAMAIRRAFGPLMDYDVHASLKLLDYITMTVNDQVATAQKVCEMTPDRCFTLADLLLREGREGEAVHAYERWIERSRNRVRVSNGLQWLVRHYYRAGKRERAEELAYMVAGTGSARGMETLAHLLDTSGRYDEAEALYVRISERYDDAVPLGTFYVRQALRNDDRALELKGWDNLRKVFPTGMERLALHALDPTPLDGVTFRSFGRRAASAGLQPTDIIVGVDEWRVRTNYQYIVAAQLRHEDTMTMTVWRGGRYQQLRLRVPERWLQAGLADYKAMPARP